jgi:hypothetical protein
VVRHGESLLPVLARRLQAVEAVFPGMTQRSVRTSNGFGWALGRAAADLADLGRGRTPLCPTPSELTELRRQHREAALRAFTEAMAHRFPGTLEAETGDGHG